MVALAALIFSFLSLAPLVHLWFRLGKTLTPEILLATCIIGRVLSRVCHASELHDDSTTDAWDPSHVESYQSFFSAWLPFLVLATEPTFRISPTLSKILRRRTEINLFWFGATLVACSWIVSLQVRIYIMTFWTLIPMAIWSLFALHFDRVQVGTLRGCGTGLSFGLGVLAAFGQGYGWYAAIVEVLVAAALTLALLLTPFQPETTAQSLPQSESSPVQSPNQPFVIAPAKDNTTDEHLQLQEIQLNGTDMDED